MSLRLRLFGLLSLSLLLTVGASVAALSWHARRAVMDQAGRDVAVLAQVLGRAAALARTLPDDMEAALGADMLGMSRILARYVAAAEAAGQTPGQIVRVLNELVASGTVAEIWITDERGHAYLNAPLGIDFTFSPDPRLQPQAAAFWPLLSGEQSAVVQPLVKREIDERWFKYAGVGGVDRPRIVQVGRDAQSLTALRERVGLQRMLDGIVRTRMLDTIVVVDRELATLAAASSLAPGATALDAAARAALSTVLREGQILTRLEAQDLQVFAPLVDGADRASGAFMVRLSRGELDDLLIRQTRTALLIGLLVLVLGGGASLIYARRLTDPLARIAVAAGEVQAGRFELPGLATVTARGDELGRLARVFAGMAQEVAGRERVLDELVARRTLELQDKHAALMRAQQQITDELAVARALQAAILPDAFPPVSGYRGAARMLPARQLGGDFYDFIELPGQRVGLVIADVSGKGAPAAFFMAVARTNLRSVAARAVDPARALARANELICAQNPLDLFVTVFFAILDPRSGALAYANGGHNPPLLRRANGQVEALPTVDGLVLGVMPEASFGSGYAQLAPGDRLLLFTDGITEAMNDAHALYGEARLRALFAAAAGDADALVEEVIESVQGFAAGAQQSDDITLAVLARDAAVA